MSAYRFCRTDDIELLVEALNRCWGPYFPDEPPVTAASFKRSIRDLQVWCSSCMVAFSDGDPIGVLIGAKRPAATLVHRIAVHPDHRRQGHGRHLLDSLGSKLAILGPPRIVAEVPETLEPASELFRAAGYAEETVLTDYVLGGEPSLAPGAGPGSFVIPVTVEDLAANGLLGERSPAVAWARSVETVRARKEEISGLAIVNDEQIAACLLYIEDAAGPDRAAEIVALECFVEDEGTRLAHLVARLRDSGLRTLRFPKVHPAELSEAALDTLGFRPAAAHRLYVATLDSAPGRVEHRLGTRA